MHEFFTMLYVLDIYTVQRKIPDSIPAGIFPPGVHQCYQAAGAPVPLSLQPSTVAHVPLTEQNPVENLALEAESAWLSCVLAPAHSFPLVTVRACAYTQHSLHEASGPR